MIARLFARQLRKLWRGTGPILLGERDCHCHVLPGVDDGSRSMAESLAMLRLLVMNGVKTVIATPHIFPGRFDNEPEYLRRRFDLLERASAVTARDAPLRLDLDLGQDGTHAVVRVHDGGEAVTEASLPTPRAARSTAVHERDRKSVV